MLLYLLDSSKLYQWDTGRHLIINKENVDTVYFFHEGAEFALSVKVIDKRARIPAELLAESKDIRVRLISNKQTVGLGFLKIIARPRPSSYIDTEEDYVTYLNLCDIMEPTYVTPEMFGNGEPFEIRLREDNDEDKGPRWFKGTDWSKEIQMAIDTGLPVYFGSKEYCCRDVFTKNVRNVHLKGTGKTVIKWKLAETRAGRAPAAVETHNENGDRAFMGMISDDNYQYSTDNSYESRVDYRVDYIKGGDILLENIIFDGNGDVIPTDRINKGNTNKPSSFQEWDNWRQSGYSYVPNFDGYFDHVLSGTKFKYKSSETEQYKYYQCQDSKYIEKIPSESDPASNYPDAKEKDIYFKEDGQFRQWNYNGGNPFGLCVFYCRDNVTVKNCVFQNCIADGLMANGLRHSLKVEGTVFKNLGIYQPFDGTRNGITVTRTCYDRGTNTWPITSNKLFVEINNSCFSNIADECIRADGITCLTIDNCTMNDIGHFILETGHRTDKSSFTHTLKNCTGNRINAIYDTGSDGGVYNQTTKENWKGFPYEGSVKILNCHFTNLFETNASAQFKRANLTALATCYDSTSNVNYNPMVFIEGSTFTSAQDDANKLGYLNSSFLGGSFVYLKDSDFLFKCLRARNIISCSKELRMENCNLCFHRNGKSGDTGVANTYVEPYFAKAFFKDSYIKITNAMHMFLRAKKDSSVIFENCTFDTKDAAYSYIVIALQGVLSELILRNNLFIGKVDGRCVNGDDGFGETVGAIKTNISNNYFPLGYSDTFGAAILPGSFSSNFKIFKDNCNYSS